MYWGRVSLLASLAVPCTFTLINNVLFCVPVEPLGLVCSLFSTCCSPVQLGDCLVRLMTEMSKHMVNFFPTWKKFCGNKSVNIEGTGEKKDRCYLQNRCAGASTHNHIRWFCQLCQFQFFCTALHLTDQTRFSKWGIKCNWAIFHISKRHSTSIYCILGRDICGIRAKVSGVYNVKFLSVIKGEGC